MGEQTKNTSATQQTRKPQGQNTAKTASTNRTATPAGNATTAKTSSAKLALAPGQRARSVAQASQATRSANADAARTQQRSTRHEQIEQRREARKREAERQRRNTLIGRGVLGGAAVLVVALIVYGVVNYYQNQAPSSISGIVTYSNLARTHVTGTVKYPQNPPVGGPHNPVWLNCGIYDAPVANENAVHSMEHGAVWITYQPDLSSKDVATLRSLVSGHMFVILSPYTAVPGQHAGLPAPVVVSAWGVQLKVQSANDPRIAQFIKKYEQGPQTQEPGAACSGGTGNPIQ
ncbi:MAG: DUF3105 domain-containing protein [Ktedonobacterales bacterium]